jgi:hypothetical protein
MQLRHRTPTIFSIYMVDVLCCALGCVVLMWQYNLNDAEEKAAAERAALESLAESNLSLGLTTEAKKKLESQLAMRESDNIKLTGANMALQALLAERENDIKTLANNNASLTNKNTTLANNYLILEKLLASREKENKALAQDLKDKTTQYVLLEVKLDKTMAERNKLAELSLVLKKDFDDAKAAEAVARKAGAELEKLVAKLRMENKILASDTKNSKDADLAKLAENARLIADNARIINELNVKIEQARQQLTSLEKDAKAQGIKLSETNLTLQDALARNRKLDTQVEQLQADLKQSRVKAELLDQETARLRAELADVRNRHKDLANLSKKELDLAKAMAEKLKVSIETRFAGITLTGSQVVFLVDMSGSMGWKDENTEDPDKWPIVCDTVGKLMLSLPDLKQYQIIMFSSGVSFPLGSEGRWLDFEGQKSVDAAVKKLKSLKPEGGTNIHSAFTEVFKYRKLGLDTVYFFSDGLPTSGEGLPAANDPAAKNLNDRQKTEMLSAHVRKTLKTVWNRPIPNSPLVRINTIGFFYESPDVGSFLWALAREHDGSFVGMSKP